MSDKVAVVVLNYKSSDDTIECLRSLRMGSYADIECIVIDNDSRDRSLNAIHNLLAGECVPHLQIAETEIDTASSIAARTILLQSSRNAGYAAGNNLGIRVALLRKAKYILILNSDTLVEPGFLEPLVRYLETHDRVAAAGPKVVNGDGVIDRACARRRPPIWAFFFISGMGRRLFPNNRWARRHVYAGEYDFNAAREVDILSGCCMLFKARVLQQIGLLDEGTFLYFEELILHEKLRAIGMTSAVVPDSVIVHKHGRSTAKAPSRIAQKASLSSFRHYLTQYRHCNGLAASLVILSTASPKALIKSIWSGLHPAPTVPKRSSQP